MSERRSERLASIVKNIFPAFFREEIDIPRDTLLSIMYVTVKDGGGKVTIFVSIFPDSQKERVAKLLKVSENRATHFLREHSGLKYSPAIRFQVVDNLAR